MKLSGKLLATVAACGLAWTALPASAADVTQDRLNNAVAEPENWLIPFGNYSSHRYTTLSDINRGTARRLRVAFTVPLNDALRGNDLTNNEGAPLVDGGMMYLNSMGGFLYKIDVTAGDRGVVVWKLDATNSEGGEGTFGQMLTRGVAMYQNSIVDNMDDGRVIRVDRDSGEIVWDAQIARVLNPGHSGVNMGQEGFHSNPLVAEGMVLVGNSKGDWGTRGWVAGVDFDTGEEQWRFYTVPSPDDPGGETWADDHEAWRTGGAGIWTGGSYDPGQSLYIIGTAQPVPMFDPEFRPGDNLYTNSAIALDVQTGNLEWYFQYTPNESWDYDENGVHMLVDARFGGDDRQMVVHFGRNGIFYQLDRTNGQFIDATQYVTQVTWTAGIDPKTGLPVEYDPNLDLQTYIPETRWARADTEPKTACPMLAGGVRWQPPAYNPVTEVAYVGGEDGCQTHMIVAAVALEDGGIDEGGRRAPATRADEPLGGLVAAIDVSTGSLLNRVITPYRNKSGILATSSGVIFTAFEDGTVAAMNDVTLEVLWSFSTGIGIKSPPISYSVDGKQYIAIIAGANQENNSALGSRGWGSMLYVFSL